MTTAVVLSPKDNPPMTLPDGRPLAEIDEPWTAIYSKPRQEKALAWDLCRKRVPYFIPMLRRETYSGGRRRRNLAPMFKSYLFFAGDDACRLAVQKTERVVKLVEITEFQQEQFRDQIFSLELGLRTEPDSIELYPRLIDGAWVRVIGGAMKGAQGTILDAKDKLRHGEKAKLLLGVSMMGSGAAVTIHPDLVEPWDRDERHVPKSTVTVEYDLEYGRPGNR